MNKNRLEAFSDGVLAIIITIMVLELRPPHEVGLSSLFPLIPKFLSYVLSFIYLAIYWNNHHHLFQVVKEIKGPILWANMHLLFWLSLIPFVTAWSGENHFEPVPVASYGLVLFMAAIAYYILVQSLLKNHSKNSKLVLAIQSDLKGRISAGIYAFAIPIAFWFPAISLCAYIAVAAIWFKPDTRIENILKREP